MVPAAPLTETAHGHEPAGAGWFVLNARDAPWVERPGRGATCEFEGLSGAATFAQLGVNVTVLAPGEPMAMYHWDDDQEDFLLLAGEALLVIEGEERPLRPFDLVHCPAGTRHVIVGAGTANAVLVAIGARVRSTGPDWGAYTVDAVAVRHGASVERETTSTEEAYARFPARRPTRYRDGWLPAAP
jgi:uncharacterized cupin superfamily protein